MTKDGKPYGPIRYREIVRECYLISKYCNTSYSDLLHITPTERTLLLEFIAEQVKKEREAMEEAQANRRK